MSLLASYMKANTKLQIDRKQYQLTCITIQQQRVEDQISDLTKADDMARSAWESIKSSMKSISSSVFTATTSFTTQNVLDKSSAYTTALSDAKGNENDPKVLAAKKEMLDAQSASQNTNIAAAATQQASQAGFAIFDNSVRSVFDASSDAQRECLSRQDKAFDGEKANIETQLKSLNAQYDSYEKLEDADAKKMAPNFGISG